MIVRTWSGRVPQEHADRFQRHLVATGVSDYRRHGCVHIELWRRDDAGWARFTLVSKWRDLESLRAYAGPDHDAARLYPGDAAFGLVPDLRVHHHHVLELDAAP